MLAPAVGACRICAHAEAIEIVFDPWVFSYQKRLGFFFQMHDPTTLSRQSSGRPMGAKKDAIFACLFKTAQAFAALE